MDIDLRDEPEPGAADGPLIESRYPSGPHHEIDDEAIERVHADVLQAEERCERRIHTRRAVQQLIEARRVEAEVLTTLGFDSYAASVVSRRRAAYRRPAATQQAS